MPPAYVKPYVKRQKNDPAGAEAICEAVGRPTMRFVETKTPEQQGCLTLRRPLNVQAQWLELPHGPCKSIAVRKESSSLLFFMRTIAHAGQLYGVRIVSA